MLALKFIFLIIFSYFIGNISNARILSHFKKSDITKQGSGNPGTMNMIRSFGLGVGILTLVLDMLKGVIPAVVGYFLLGAEGLSYVGIYTAGLAVVIGHMYPVCYKFKGGKSVACALGVFCVATPIWLVAVFFCSLLYLYFFDYGAVFSFIVITILTCSQAIAFSSSIPICMLLLATYLIIMFAHRQNIIRLLIGKENKVKFKKSIIKMLKKDIPKETKKEIKEKNIG
ncbi:MAG: glycerol-3-phosphate acyltransferase [Clostridia bacterium]